VPAKTTEQLREAHSQWLDAADSESPEKFRAALNEVMPRIYKMGYWREMFVEHTQDASDGYVSLPENTDSIVAAIIDNNAVPTRSLWHDYKLFGTNDSDTNILHSFIDDGYASTYRDIETSFAYQLELQAIKGVQTSLPTTAFTVDVRYEGSNTGDGYLNFQLSNTTTADTGSGVDISNIKEIVYNNIPDEYTIRVIADPFDDSFDAVTLADLSSGSGVVRYRRYRVGGTDSSSSAHMLLKRRWVDVDGPDDLMHIPSHSIIKHALLGKLSEDTADAKRAMYHWGVVKELLEADTDSFRGAAKPNLHVAPDGVGGGMRGMY